MNDNAPRDGRDHPSQPLAPTSALIGDWVKWDAKGLAPAVIQDDGTGEVLTVCYLNQEALDRTLATGLVHLFRRSCGRVMVKGEVSGMTQHVREVRLDCEGNALLFRVRPAGPACHVGYHTCFFRRLETGAWQRVGEPEVDPALLYPAPDKAVPPHKEGQP